MSLAYLVADKLLTIAAGASQLVHELSTKAAMLRGLNSAAIHMLGPDSSEELDS